MRKKQVNRKPLFLLLVLTLVSVFLVKNSSRLDLKKERVLLNIKKPTECKSCQAVGGIKENVEEETTGNIVLLDQSQIVDVTDQAVLAAGSGVGCGDMDSTFFLSLHRPICSKDGAGDIDFSGSSNVSSGGEGVVVSKDSDIVITKITYPLALWKGPHTYVDNNKQIRKESPAHKSNGKQIDSNLIARSLSPYEVTEFLDSITGTEKTPFTVEAKVNLLGSVEEVREDSVGKYKVIDTSTKDCEIYGRPCDEVFNEYAVSDFNVGKSNRIASDEKFGGYLGGQAPQGDQRVIDEEPGCLVEGRHFSKINKDQGVVEDCNERIAILKGLFMKSFSLLKWKKCNPSETVDPSTGQTTTSPATEKCVDTKTLGIKMTTLFGEPDRQEDELAANAYLSQLYRGSLSPSESKDIVLAGNPKNSEMFFVATDCGLTIDGHYVSALCLWDASPILYTYKLQERDTAPKQEDFPDNFASYWHSVLKSVELSKDAYGIQ
jgi:hypothetical protein